MPQYKYKPVAIAPQPPKSKVFNPRVWYRFNTNTDKYNFVPMEGTWSEIKNYMLEQFKKNCHYSATYQNGDKVQDEDFLRGGTRINIKIIKNIKIFYKFKLDQKPAEKNTTEFQRELKQKAEEFAWRKTPFHWLNQEGTWEELRLILARHSKNFSHRELQAEYVSKPGVQIDPKTYLYHGDKISVYQGFPLGTIKRMVWVHRDDEEPHEEECEFGRFHEILDWGGNIEDTDDEERKKRLENKKIEVLQKSRCVPFSNGTVFKYSEPEPEEKNKTPPKGYACNKCGEHHFVRDCQEIKNDNSPPEDYVCKLCDESGHYMVNCETRDAPKIDLRSELVIRLSDYIDDEFEE